MLAEGDRLVVEVRTEVELGEPTAIEDRVGALGARSSPMSATCAELPCGS